MIGILIKLESKQRAPHNRSPFIYLRLVIGKFFKHKLTVSKYNLFEGTSCIRSTFYFMQFIAGPQKCLTVWSPQPLLLCEYNILKPDDLWGLWLGKLSELQALSGSCLIGQVKHLCLFALRCSSLAQGKLEPERNMEKNI